MKIVLNNPYRIAGILSNATARKLQQRKAKTRAFTKVGKEVDSEYDFEFLGHENKRCTIKFLRSKGLISNAFKKINIFKNLKTNLYEKITIRLYYFIVVFRFWFWADERD